MPCTFLGRPLGSDQYSINMCSYILIFINKINKLQCTVFVGNFWPAFRETACRALHTNMAHFDDHDSFINLEIGAEPKITAKMIILILETPR